MLLRKLSAAAAIMLTGAALAQSPVTVTLGPVDSAPALRSDFLGLSFGMKALLPDKSGTRFFSPTNSALIMLFQNLGLKHLRVGGTTVESPPSTPIPNERDIDSLFGFMKAAGVEKVIYSLRLLETNADLHYDRTDAALARYLWDHHRSNLDCFALGNEPDRRQIFSQDVSITGFPTYMQKWNRFASTITNAVPGARFAGPDAGSGNIDWTTRFAEAARTLGMVQEVTEHFYVGGAGKGKTSAEGIEAILSPDWLAANHRLYERMAMPVLAAGFPYRFTEASDHYSGGIPGASDTFAGALWALDFLNWWAEHGAIGVDFHNTQWVVNDVITRLAGGRLAANPKGYGLKAFSLMAKGGSRSLALANPQNLNLTAYARTAQDEDYVALINKEHGPEARDASVKIVLPGKITAASAMSMSVLGGAAEAKSGVSLGGDTIDSEHSWNGKWRPIEPGSDGAFVVTVPKLSAALLRFHNGTP